ncbi:MAG: DUF308 domain-containing protein [Oscillospiraceae bacterium]|nr:DUF308 domain-containing protein [Oscillospiraceae bacterium]
MLFEELDKIKRDAVMMTIVLMFIGLLLLLIPEVYILFLEGTLGFTLLVAAALSVLRFLSGSKVLMHYIELVFGLGAGLLGIMIMLYEGLFLWIVSWLVGILPILSGIHGIFHTLAFLRHSGKKGWWVLIVLSALLIVFGGLVIWHPWLTSTQGMLQVVGGVMLYSALVSGLKLIWLWPVQRR